MTQKNNKARCYGIKALDSFLQLFNRKKRLILIKKCFDICENGIFPVFIFLHLFWFLLPFESKVSRGRCLVSWYFKTLMQWKGI